MPRIIKKVSVQEDYIPQHDDVVMSLFIQTDNEHEAEFLKIRYPFDSATLARGLRNLADKLDEKYKR